MLYQKSNRFPGALLMCKGMGLAYLRLVLYRMQSETKHILPHTYSPTHKPLPSAAGVCQRRRGSSCLLRSKSSVRPTRRLAGSEEVIGSNAAFEGEAWGKCCHVSGKFLRAVQPPAPLMVSCTGNQTRMLNAAARKREIQPSYGTPACV